MSPEEILEKLRQKWQEVEEKATRLLEAFNSTLRKIARFAGWIAEKAANFWNNTVVPAWQRAVAVHPDLMMSGVRRPDPAAS